MVSSENPIVKSVTVTPLDEHGNVAGLSKRWDGVIEGRVVSNWVEPEVQEKLFLQHYKPIEWSWTLDMTDWNNRRLFNILTGNRETKIWKEIARRRNSRRGRE